MSVLGDRIISYGPAAHGEITLIAEDSITVAEWNGLRQELIDLRAQAAAYVDRLSRDQAAALSPPIAGGLRLCPICQTVKIGPTLVECSSCAGREDAAAKRAADQ